MSQPAFIIRSAVRCNAKTLPNIKLIQNYVLVVSYFKEYLRAQERGYSYQILGCKSALVYFVWHGLPGSGWNTRATRNFLHMVE